MNTPILPSEEVRITHKSTVSLHFEVSLMNGEVIDSTFHRQEPVTLTIGDESLLAGFEKVLINLKAGDTRTATLSADDAFGQWNLKMSKLLLGHNLPYLNPILWLV